MTEKVTAATLPAVESPEMGEDAESPKDSRRNHGVSTSGYSLEAAALSGSLASSDRH